MEITLITQECLRIKGKHTSLIVDPDSLIKGKIPADAILLLNKKDTFDSTKIEDYRIVIKGAGEYEVSGIKISAFTNGEDIVYSLLVDGLHVVLAKTGTIDKIIDKISGNNISILLVTSKIDQSILASLETRIVLLYGENIRETVVELDKERMTTATKFTTTVDKLPDQMEVVVLNS